MASWKAFKKIQKAHVKKVIEWNRSEKVGKRKAAAQRLLDKPHVAQRVAATAAAAEFVAQVQPGAPGRSWHGK